MTDLELVTAALDRCLRRSYYDGANLCKAAEYELKMKGELSESTKTTMWKLLKMRPKAPETPAQMGYARYRTRREENE